MTDKEKFQVLRKAIEVAIQASPEEFSCVEIVELQLVSLEIQKAIQNLK